MELLDGDQFAGADPAFDELHLAVGGARDNGSRLQLAVLADDVHELAALLLQRTKGVRSVEERDGHLVLEFDDDTHDFSHIAAALVKSNFKIRELKEEEVNLETAFMRLTKGLVQ